METLKKILDLPVILQGALGSCLFWLAFTIIKAVTSGLSNSFNGLNKSWKEEKLEFDQMQSQFMLADPQARIQYLLLFLYGAANRTLQGLIYLCLGLAVNTILEPFGFIGFGFAIAYFFRALRVIPFQTTDGKSKEWHEKNVAAIAEKLRLLRSKK